ncbi:MAG: hypothetical protein KBD16_00435 [Candidatus Pacebacteria bacterium]|nr:hypothetical protein [Candidatus Paceibacterota bacterium]
MKIAEMPLRRDAATELDQLGVYGVAAEAILRETAPFRRNLRVEKVLAVASAATNATLEVGDGTGFDTVEISAIGATLALLRADTYGVGGKEGVEGAGTSRVPALSILGKGRKQASDGGAWSAAIAEATERVVGVLASLLVKGGIYGVSWRWLATSSGLRFGVLALSTGNDGQNVESLVTAIDPNQGRFDIVPGTDTPSGEALIPLLWQRTIAREGLRRAVGLKGWFTDPEFDEFGGDAANWAAVVNEIDAAIVAANTSQS